MKTTLLALFLLVILAACKEDTPAPVVEMIPVKTDVDTLLTQGTFRSEAHTTSGTVTIYQRTDNQLLVLEDFRTDNGPALYVYLSADRTSVQNFVNLGELKSTSGTFSYEIPDSVNTEQYPYVLIWCRRFSVLFGSAQPARL